MAEELEADWEVTVTVPLRLPAEQREALFNAVADAVAEWEPDDRQDWDAIVSAHPETFSLLLWLHAKAVWQRDGVRVIADHFAVELARLRREVEFEANSLETGAEYLGFEEPCRVCACAMRAVGDFPRFARPVCTVHPGGTDEATGDGQS